MMHPVISSFFLIWRWLWETSLYFTSNIIRNRLSFLGSWPLLNYLKSIITHDPSKPTNKVEENSDTYSCVEEDVEVEDMGTNCMKPEKSKEDVQLEMPMTQTQIESSDAHQKHKGMNMSGIDVSQEIDRELEVEPTNPEDAFSEISPDLSQIQSMDTTEPEPTTPCPNQTEDLDSGISTEAQITSKDSMDRMSELVPSKSIKITRKKKNKRNKRTSSNNKISESVASTINDESNALDVDDSNYNTNSFTIRDGGLGRGIEGANNSCYLDSTLFSMFYYLDILDSRMLKGEMVKDSRCGDKNSDEVTNILVTIVSKMRGGYCPSEYTAELRHRMMHINKRLRSDMMDVDELISNLCGSALHLKPFVKYSVGTTNYLHQILINPSKQRARVGHLQDLLVESMQMQGLKLGSIPEPALIIKMPRSNGQLVGHQYILPNLTLDLSPVSVQEEEGQGQCTNMDLMAVIVLRYYHYTAFVRCGTDTISPWVYYNDLPGNVTRKNGIGEKLSKLEETNNRESVPHDLQQIMGDIHVCIYQPQKS